MAATAKPKMPSAGAWTFENAAIAEAFDAHVREQLPWYDIATGVVAAVGRHFIPERGRVYDVGASTGNVGRALASTLQARSASFLPIEPSAEMRARYSGPGTPIDATAEEAQFLDADLIVCFLVLMFVPVRSRRQLIARMTSALRPGGAIVVFDKLAPAAGDPGILTLRLTLGAKYEAGASPDEIIAKELSLAGVQRPLYAAELDGFAPIFRFGDFGGWLRVREP